MLVNFDKEIMQLIRETKYMQRFGIAVPEGAQTVLLQEEKFKWVESTCRARTPACRGWSTPSRRSDLRPLNTTP